MALPPLLVRHTEPEIARGFAPPLWPASARGRRLAHALAELPVFAEVSAVLSSPEPKALATAEPIARRAGVTAAVVADLREVERPRGWTEGYDDRVRAYLGGGTLPGWEPLEDARGRVYSAIDGAPPGAAIVSHGIVLALYLGEGYERWRAIPIPGVFDGRRWLSVR